MPLISKATKSKKQPLRIMLSSNVKEEVLAYCRWAGIADVSHFFTEAAEYVFSKDKEWRQERDSFLSKNDIKVATDIGD